MSAQHYTEYFNMKRYHVVIVDQYCWYDKVIAGVWPWSDRLCDEHVWNWYFYCGSI